MTQKQQREQALVAWINRATAFRCEKLEMVSGDASFRRYFRFRFENQSIIAVDAPPQFEDSSKFVEIAQLYRQAGVSVPNIYAHDAELGFYLQEDFGDAQFADALDVERAESLYLQALGFLPAIQSCTAIGERSLPLFDQNLLDSELYLFTHWLLEVHLNLTLSPRHIELINKVYSLLTDTFKAQPQVGVHRDYHCRNLMMIGDNQVGIIDFQDAVIGPVSYDIVSLLKDCYQDWPDELIQTILQKTHQQHYSQYDWQIFQRWFDLTGVQRHIKASGIFCRLYHRDSKDNYLKDIPHTLNYIVKVSKRYPELSQFGEWLEETVIPMMRETLR